MFETGHGPSIRSTAVQTDDPNNHRSDESDRSFVLPSCVHRHQAGSRQFGRRQLAREFLEAQLLHQLGTKHRGLPPWSEHQAGRFPDVRWTCWGLMLLRPATLNSSLCRPAGVKRFNQFVSLVSLVEATCSRSYELRDFIPLHLQVIKAVQTWLLLVQTLGTQVDPPYPSHSAAFQLFLRLGHLI